MRLHLLASLLFLPTLVVSQQPVSLSVSLDRPIGAYKPIDRWFGYDEGNYTTTPAGRALLGELHDLSPVPVTIRAHHLFTSGNGTPELKWSSTGVYSEDAQGNPVYNFTLLDGIFDAYKQAGVRPMVELGFMPQDLAAVVPGHDAYQVHYPKSTVSGASNNPPKDYAKWGELVRTVTAHLVQRYGESTVRTWYFEVWNEPDIDYWHGTLKQYEQLYDTSVAAVRAALPTAIVGGPASTGPSGRSGGPFLQGFLAHIAATKTPLDFISFHAKGQPKVLADPANPAGTVTMGIRNELSDVDQGFATVAKFPQFQHLPIILSEADPEGCAACSSKVNPANNYRNGTLYPAYTAAAYKALFALQDRRQVNLIGMLSWSFEFEGRDYFEGFRDLSTNGIDKPILNLFRMTALLKGTRVQTTSTGEVPLETLLSTGVRTSPDVDAMATAAPHQATILLWNYHDSNTPAPSTPTTVTITGLPASLHTARLTHYRIDENHSNSYTAWQAMGSPQHPTPAQIAQLKSSAGLQTLTAPGSIPITHGMATVTTTMPRQSVSLLQLTW